MSNWRSLPVAGSVLMYPMYYDDTDTKQRNNNNDKTNHLNNPARTPKVKQRHQPTKCQGTSFQTLWFPWSNDVIPPASSAPPFELSAIIAGDASGDLFITDGSTECWQGCGTPARTRERQRLIPSICYVLGHSYGLIQACRALSACVNCVHGVRRRHPLLETTTKADVKADVSALQGFSGLHPAIVEST